LLAGIGCARERIDLRDHEGAHPRIGAADVVPIVALDPADRERAKDCALRLADRIGSELGLPVFLYAESSPGRGPAFYRRGGPVELQRRIDAGELSPDFGPGTLDERAGGVIVGARNPLIAFNVNLATDDAEVARSIAAVVREAGGGFPGVRALGLALPRAGRAQVSMNVEDWEAAALHDIVERVESEAHARGVDVVGAELVGLMPAGAAAAAAGAILRIDGFNPSHVLELRLLERRRA
jgi:glutamate formiminotransferase